MQLRLVQWPNVSRATWQSRDLPTRFDFWSSADRLVVGSEPDASHASYATWREFQWCPGDENWGRQGAAGGETEEAAARGEGWALEAAAAAAAARGRPPTTPFDD